MKIKVKMRKYLLSGIVFGALVLNVGTALATGGRPPIPWFLVFNQELNKGENEFLMEQQAAWQRREIARMNENYRRWRDGEVCSVYDYDAGIRELGQKTMDELHNYRQ